jgi:Glycosyl hydrolase family 46
MRTVTRPTEYGVVSIASIRDSVGDQTQGGRLVAAQGSEWRASPTLPAAGRAVSAIIVLVAVPALPSCRSKSDGKPVDVPAASVSDLTADQRLRADRLINNFEHGTTEFLYGSAEPLPDGRGITFGRAGFTTKSGDGYDVIKGFQTPGFQTPTLRRFSTLQTQNSWPRKKLAFTPSHRRFGLVPRSIPTSDRDAVRAERNRLSPRCGRGARVFRARGLSIGRSTEPC